MNFINDAVNYILSFKAYVMLPMLMFIICMIIRMKVTKALTHCITLGIGFIGIFIVFDYFVGKIGPVIESIVKSTGSSMNVLDVGWPPMAAITWSFKLAPLMILIIIGVNIVMLLFKLTSTVNIDIWNYWHFIFTSQLVYFITSNILLAIAAGIAAMILTVKLGDWSAERVAKISGLKGISITTLSGQAYYPIGIIMDKIMNHIPGLNKVNANPENIKKRLGFFGEPMFIGLVMGAGLGIAAGYNVKDVFDLAFSIAAVVFILPRMCSILGEGLMPISDGAKAYILKKFPSMKNAYIGMDLAVLVGNPAAVVTGILLMPVALVLALILPGVRFIPLGDLPNLIGATVLIVVACRGNVIRSMIASIPVIIGKLYVASAMADTYTTLAQKANFSVKGYNGTITSFLDGGNLLRTWFAFLFSGKLWAVLLLIIIIPVIIYTRKVSKAE